ncbi:MAG: hypothetical protein FJ088_02450 [Deltaproteobacteria bacterium]|nr:hypothetical protein [Deltaproteobacteria bacterium]
MENCEDRFALPAVPSFMEGVYLGVNAVKDAYLLVNCPQGCYYRFEKVSINHDAASTLYDPLGCHRIIQSGINYTELAMGTEETLFKLVKKVVEKVKPRALFFTQVSMTLVTSFDAAAFASEMERRFSVPLFYIPPATFNGDFLEGFNAFMETLVEAVMGISRAKHGASGTASVCGYFADRLEEDHIANADEISRLIGSAGIECGGVALSGASLEELGKTFAAPAIVNLPYARSAGRKIAEMTGAPVIDLDLPVGIEGTVKWIRDFAGACGGKADAEKFIGRELGRIIPKIAIARRRYLLNRSVAIAADPYLAPVLAIYASELGMNVPLVALKTRNSAVSGRAREILGNAGMECKVINDFPHEEFHAAVAELSDEDRCDAVIGTDAELDAASDAGTGFVEIGYPSFFRHSFFPQPFMGFSGALRIANDLVNAVQQRDYSANK